MQTTNKTVYAKARLTGGLCHNLLHDTMISDTLKGMSFI